MRCEDGVGPPSAIRFRPGLGRETGSPKRSEPHDWQRDATSPRPPSGGNRRGGAKPRGRNGIPRLAPRDRSAQRCAREWTLGRYPTRDALARHGVGGGVIGARFGSRRKPRFGTAPPDESHERRSSSTRGSSECSGGERRPEGLHVAGSSAREGRRRRGAVGTPRRPAQRCARPGREREGHLPATTTPRSSSCRPFRTAVCPAPEGRVNPTRAPVDPPASVGAGRR